MVTISMKVILNFGKKKRLAIGQEVCNKHDEFQKLALQAIAEERLCKGASTVENYLTALRSFVKFAGGHLLLADFNGQLVEQYQQSLKVRGVCLNTISCYMRSLRVIYKKVSEKTGAAGANPFSNVFMGKTKTSKRSIDCDDIIRIQQLDLPVISKALGHTNTSTTITYIREIDDASIAEANRHLLGVLRLAPVTPDGTE